MGDEFNILAAKVLAGEATEAEQARLKTLLALNEELRKEFASLQVTWKSFGALAPLVSALNAAPASIPAERLKQLQQVVRDDTQAKEAAKSNLPGPPRRPEHPVSVFFSAVVRNWLERHVGRSPALVSLVLLAILMGVVFLMNRPATNPRAVPSLSPVAYLLSNHGQSEIRRAGQKLTAQSVTPLRTADEVYLPPGSEVDIITPGQVFRFQGPRTIKASALAGPAVPAHIQSELTARTETLRSVLFKPVPQLLAANLLVTTRGGQGIPVYSPLGATASRTPLILWKSEPGKTYDLRITDEFNSAAPPWNLTAVTPPVEFAKVEAWKDRPLAKEGLYRLQVRESGQPLTAGEYTFRTLEEIKSVGALGAADPALTALSILATSPARVGDTLALLLRLPPEQAKTEIAFRLKLLIFGELGYQEDFDATAVTFRSPPGKDH